MDIIYLLIPLSIVLVSLLVWVVIWAVQSGQFDDLVSPAYRILDDSDELTSQQKSSETAGGDKH